MFLISLARARPEQARKANNSVISMQNNTQTKLEGNNTQGCIIKANLR